MRRHRFYYIALFPGGWYTFISFTTIIGSPRIGFGKITDLWMPAYIVGAIMGCVYIVALL
jgi:hypothetical protein